MTSTSTPPSAIYGLALRTARGRATIAERKPARSGSAEPTLRPWRPEARPKNRAMATATSASRTGGCWAVARRRRGNIGPMIAPAAMRVDTPQERLSRTPARARCPSAPRRPQCTDPHAARWTIGWAMRGAAQESQRPPQIQSRRTRYPEYFTPASRRTGTAPSTTSGATQYEIRK